MNPGLLKRGVPLVLACLATSSCNLINTADDENATGRGAQSFDPYQGSLSGVIKLGLTQYNGCATRPTGVPAGLGELSFSVPYPSYCPSFLDQTPAGAPVEPNPDGPPQTPLQILTGTLYFIDRIALVETVEDLHLDPYDTGAVVNWFRTQSSFAGLDWTNLSLLRESFIGFQGLHERYVNFGNANWMLDRDQTFRIEILDSAGTVQAEQTLEVSRNDFLAENRRAGHTSLQWQVAGLDTPQTRNDLRPNDFGLPLTSRTTFRFEAIGQVQPGENNFELPDTLRGDGVIRVTWSALPEKPFYWPVTFVAKDAVPPTCFTAEENPTPCDFGLDSQVVFSPEKADDTYAPGDTLRFSVHLTDALGNYLHRRTQLPSFGEYFMDQSNGLLFVNPQAEFRTLERDAIMQFKVVGPLQMMTGENFIEGAPIFQWPEGYDIPSTAGGTPLPGAWSFHPANTFEVPIPPDAVPGTYAISVKANRYWLGERVAKAKTFYFNVGERSGFPGRIGNCQICHNGVLSLDNIRHGESVDNVESCSSCHNPVSTLYSFANSIHQIHMESNTYPMGRNDCSVCHLTRESATRPSYNVCGDCHVAFHGDSYFPMEHTSLADPVNQFSNCAQACHRETPPTNHILPAE